MITVKEGESRMKYLSRVLTEYMSENGDMVIEYDDTTCDGMCLAEDIRIEVTIKDL